jgi:hypothetical protein
MSARSISRAPSEISDISRAPSGTSLHRNLSRTESMQGQEMRRSRSRSIDQSQVRPEIKRPMIRAPSGKDLFKGREVGLMRRTGSRKEIPGARRDDSQTQPSLGLLGRKTSDPKKNRVQDGTFPSTTVTDIQNRKADLHWYLPPLPNLVLGTPFLADITRLQFKKNHQVGNVSDPLS